MKGNRLPPMYPELVHHLTINGITQQQLAEAAGVTPVAINRIVRGRLMPSKALKERIASILDKDVDELWQFHPAVERQIQFAVEQGLPRELVDPVGLHTIATIAANHKPEELPERLRNAETVPLAMK